jgi:ATP-dependent Clp protease ATP-binding subunit ClpA
MSMIVDKILTQLNIRLMDQRISIEVSDEAKKWLGEEAYEPQFGARLKYVDPLIEYLIELKFYLQSYSYHL